MLAIGFICLGKNAFANNHDIVGIWKSIDDQTGFSRADVAITKNADGTYSGKIIAIRPLPGKKLVEICVKCKGALKDTPLTGLQVLDGFIQDSQKPTEFINGKMLDPLSGNTYKGRIRLNSTGKRITLRGYIGVSVIGRSQTWVRAE